MTTFVTLLTARAKRKYALRTKEARRSRNRTLRAIPRKGTPRVVFAALMAAKAAYASAMATASVELATAINTAPGRALQHWL